MRDRRVFHLLPLLAMIAALLLLAPHVEALGVRLVGVREYTVPGELRIYCATPLNDNSVLVAGSTGVPAAPYAAIISGDRLQLLTIPVPPGYVRGEIVGCMWTEQGLLLYGYLVDRNATPYATLWLYNPGKDIRYRVLDKVIVKPLQLFYTPTAVYIVGFIGSCSARGALAISYVVTTPLRALLSNSNYTGFVYAPGGVIKGRALMRIGDAILVCGYFTGVHILANGSIELIGYGYDTKGRHIGFILVHNPLLNGNATGYQLLPIAPVAVTEAGQMLVATGLMSDGTPSVLVVNPDGSYKVTRISITGTASRLSFNSIYCLTDTCLLGGVSLNGNTTVPAVALIRARGSRVTEARIYTWSEARGRVAAVVLTPSNKGYAVVISSSGRETKLYLLTLGIIQGESEESTMPVQTRSSVHEGGGNDIIIPIVLSVASVVIILTVVTYYLKTRRGRQA